ncbi:MAG: GGDEF domain-containing protein, partial [Candidatus Deferrimicrobiaceae bacterium]
MQNTLMISQALILLSVGILGYSIYPTSGVVRELPSGPVRYQWKILRGFIVFFLAGYFDYLILFASDHSTSHLLVSSIFFFGACFVLLVCLLARGTVKDIKRIVTLEAETITDPLMEIYNRRHMERRLEDEVSRARRYEFPCSLLMLDIDRFKEVNDTYGHPTGDLVLKGIGALLKENIRTTDV